MSKEVYSLYQLSQQIKAVVSDNFTFPLWVRAEIAEFRENRNGHCYLDLVEKSDSSDQIIARSKAIIWSYTYRMLRPYFETSTGRSLCSGLKVMVQVSVEFQEVYGLSLIIRDIDPAYTLGDLEQRKRETINRLKQEGVFDMNHELKLPMVPQRIAVISSPTAAGYGDFTGQLESNSYGVKFYYHLFHAIMQGDQASDSITCALDKIYANIAFFDAVVIIRGGGASFDLLCFDDYWLASNICQFPIPVITGIGHDRDQSIADLVAFSSLKTPTAVAEFLISIAADFLEKINSYSQYLEDWVTSELESKKRKLSLIVSKFSPQVNILIQQQKQNLNSLGRELPDKVKLLIQYQKNRINSLGLNIKQSGQKILTAGKNDLHEKQRHQLLLVHSIIKERKQQLHYFEKNNQLNDPFEMLKRGYTLTYFEGKLIKDSTTLDTGNIIETHFRDGNVTSIVK